MLYSADSEQCKAVLLNDLYANYRINTLELHLVAGKVLLNIKEYSAS